MNGLGGAEMVGLIMFRCGSCGRVRELGRMADPICPCGGTTWRLLAFTEPGVWEAPSTDLAASAERSGVGAGDPAELCPLAHALLGEVRQCGRGDGCAWWQVPGMAGATCLIREVFPGIETNRKLAGHLRALGGPQEWAPAA